MWTPSSSRTSAVRRWACRAGSGNRYWWGPGEDTTGKVANVGDRALKRTHPAWPRTAKSGETSAAVLERIALMELQITPRD